MTIWSDQRMMFEERVPELVDAAMERTPRWILERNGEGATRSAITREVRRDLVERAGNDFAAAFSRACPVPGLPQSAYANRLMPMSRNGFAAIGIRFRNLDPARQFVDVLHTTRPLEVADCDSVLAAYAEFRPQRVRCFCWASELTQLLEAGGAEPGKQLYVGEIREMMARGNISVPSEMKLGVPKDMSFYESYASEYRDLIAERPELDDEVMPESKETLADALSEGTLFTVSVHGTQAGVVAVALRSERGVHGYCVIEEFLYRDFRGRGLGRALQCLLVARLDIARARLLYGTISPSNHAAVRVARANCRKYLGGQVWIPSAKDATRGKRR